MSANIKRSELQILHMILGTGYSSKTKAITTEAKRTVRISKKALKLFLGTNARALRKSVYALRDLEPVICATGIVNGREPEKLRFFERIEEDHLHYYFTMTHKLQNELFYPCVYIHVDLFSVGQLKSLYALGILPFMLFRSRLPRHVSEYDLDQLAELMQAKKEYGQHMPRSKVLERFETARQHIYDEVMSVHVSIDEIDPKKKDRISLRVKPGQRRHFHKAKPGNARLMFRFKASEKMFVDANRFINLAQDLGFELGQDTARAVFQNWVMFLHEDEEACSAADFSRFEKHVWNNRGLKKVDPKEFEIAVRETWNPLNNNRFKETGKRFSGQDRAAMTQRPDGTIDPDSISIQPPDFLDEYII
ncbi:hypothetical protein XM53_00915 [Roseovarius atlanticus]|uniref:Uncharacterized protein n=2 Tax=Roseovarius atlanticus TaxID=1641875 RepID=A0A0T5NZK4_9RHOB|nr:hypothetical protein XM53_00915 [Roseovarius atlanticus]